MEVDLISKEWIKPSIPTPSNLKNYNISLLDQFMPLAYTPMILFYTHQGKFFGRNDSQLSERSLLLKQSLSQTLTKFYPLSGKIKDSLSIECNDDGVLFVKATTNVPLSKYLEKPDINLHYKLLPNKEEPGPGSCVAMVQETDFACGGICIGVYALHMVMDGSSMASFLKSWADIASEDQSIKDCNPNFDGVVMFPQHTPFLKEVNASALWNHFPTRGRITRRRFAFDASAISNLKEKTTTKENPTRVEIVSAFLINRFMAMFKAKSGIDKPMAINHAVNMRRRLMPPIPQCSVGNYVWSAATICNSNETEISSLVNQLNKAISRISNDFVTSVNGNAHEAFVKLCELKKRTISEFTNPNFSNGVDYVLFSSWCNFGLYEVDFGWGKPVWISTAGSNSDNGNVESTFLNSIVLMDSKMKKGIEVWMVLDEDIIYMLENDKDFLNYACVDPCPLVH